MALGMTKVFLQPECNDSDYAWVSLMLGAAEIPAEIVKTCGCGYGNECGMHCGNGHSTGQCSGPRYTGNTGPM